MKLHHLLFLLLAAVLAGCKKYAEAPNTPDAAYIRVFNDLTTATDVLHNNQATPFLTFLQDPKFDAGGIPADAGIIGDFMTTRQLFSPSYPYNEGNSSVTTGGSTNSGSDIGLYTLNYEYPGNAHVPAAPNMNGFDLSAWAQITSGKHRIMFVERPLNNINFKSLSSTIRSNILLDTTINFEKGEVYTLEVVSRDLDNGKYGLYVRKEQFIHQPFQTDRLYVGFVNLSGKKPLGANYGFSKVFPDNAMINYSYLIHNDAASTPTGSQFYDPLPGYDNTYYTTLNTRMDTLISYLSLPLLPDSYFFNQGILRTYSNLSTSGGLNQGTLPYFDFKIVDAGNPQAGPGNPLGFDFSCFGDPNSFNDDVDKFNGNGMGPNLNLIVNTGNAFHVYPTINIMEMIYDHVYVMQIQRGFDQLPNN